MLGVIFDLDGTILDSMSMWQALDKGFLERHGYTYNPKISEMMLSKSLEDAAALIQEEYNMTMTVEEILEEWNMELYDQYNNELQLRPGAKEVIELLYKNNIPMCIATLTERWHARPALRRLEIEDKIMFLLTVSEAGKSKRDPDIYILCAQRMGVHPNDIVVMEDSLHALETAKKAGFTVWGVVDEHTENAAEIERMADATVTDFNELLGQLQERYE